MDDWIYVTWRGNGRSKYNGQTHKVRKDTLVNPPSDLKVGDSVVVYWESDPRRKFWNAEVAPDKKILLPALQLLLLLLQQVRDIINIESVCFAGARVDHGYHASVK